MKRFIVCAVFFPLVSSAQSIQVAKFAADRCMFNDAVTFLGKAPAKERDSREGRLLLARLFVQLERGADAVAVLERLPGSNKKADEADRLLALGMALSSANRIEESSATLEKARNAGSDIDIVDGALAVNLIQQNKLDEAEALLREVLKRSPLLSGSLYNLAIIHARRGRVAESAALIRQSWHAGLMDPDQLRKDPDFAAVIKTTGLIDDLLKSPVPRCGIY